MSAQKESEPPWLAIARKEIGVKEIPGGPNSRIAEYREVVGAPEGSDWCGAYFSWVMTQAGFKGPFSAAARANKKCGTKIDEWKLGCYAIFWRFSPDDWRGHIAYALSAPKAGLVSCLGGNQAKSVCIRNYPESPLLGLYWPK